MPSLVFASKQIFSTGQVARILRMAPRTVSKMFDCGKLKGYRIPLSGDRRITRDSLIEFMRLNQFPLETLGTENSVLLVGLAENMISLIQDRIGSPQRTVQVARDVFECGRMVERYHPAVMVLDFQIGSSDCLHIREQLHMEDAASPKVGSSNCQRIMAILGEDGSVPLTRKIGFSHVFQVPFDPLDLICALAGE